MNSSFKYLLMLSLPANRYQPLISARLSLKRTIICQYKREALSAALCRWAAGVGSIGVASAGFALFEKILIFKYGLLGNVLQMKHELLSDRTNAELRARPTQLKALPHI